MIEYTAEMHHSRETLNRFIRVQYDTFEFGRKAILFAAAVGLILFGIAKAAAAALLSVICLIGGCLLLTNIDAKAKSVADGVAEAMKGKYPSLQYSFSDSGFRDGEGKEEVPYSRLFRLMADEKYLYLFISKASGYMLELSTVSGEADAEGLKSFLSGKTGLKWLRPVTLMNFNIKDLIAMLRK